MSSTQRTITFPVKKTRSCSRNLFKVGESKESPITSYTPLKSPLKTRSCSRNLFKVGEGKESPITSYTLLKSPLKTRQCQDNVDLGNSPLKRVRVELEIVKDHGATLFTPKSLSLATSPKNRDGLKTPVKRASVNNENGSSVSPRKLGSGQKRKLDRDETSLSRGLVPTCLFKQDVSNYNEVKNAFATTNVCELHCRETEIATITSFLHKHLDDGRPGSMYISGAPGTGKTACLDKILRSPEFSDADYRTVTVNCMSLKTPGKIYERIWSKLKSGTSSTRVKFASDYEQLIKKELVSSDSSILLMLDEVDCLTCKDQAVLYTIFEWPSLEGSNLILIGIANALDLTDRMLPRLRVMSKCRPELLHFAPYTTKQISTILQTRLDMVSVESRNVITTVALQFCARKVASVAGDIRKALDVCRRAVEIVEAGVRKQHILKPNTLGCASAISSTTSSRGETGFMAVSVELSLMVSVLNEVYGNTLSNRDVTSDENALPLQQQILLCTFLLVLRKGKYKEITLGKLQEVFARVCKRNHLSAIDQSDFVSLCGLLEARGLLVIKSNKNVRMSKVNLKLDESEVEFVLQDKCLLASILEDTSCLTLGR